MRVPLAARLGRFAGPAVILLAAVAAIAPQMVHGNSCGDDFDFHLVSWLDAAHSWREGILYPHWAPSANYGAGEPRFVFYPPLTWMLGAALGLVMSWKAVPIALTFLLLAGAGLATRALARYVMDEGPAALAGCVAIFFGYALFTAYERSAFGELTGGFWIPLLLLLTLRDRNAEGSLWRRAFDGSAALLALVVAGVWLSDVPLGVMASYLLAAFALAVALLHRSWAPVVRAAAGVAVGLGLSAFFLVPAAVEQSWVAVREATDEPGMRIENNWLFGHHADPVLQLHDVELRRVSIIGTCMIALALASLLVAGLRGRITRQRGAWIALALIPFAVLFLMLPVSLPVWNVLPKLRFLQFPWRWLVALEAPLGIFLASAVWSVNRKVRAAVLACCAGVALLLPIATTPKLFFFQPCDEEDAVWAMLDTYSAGTGFEGEDEYAPPRADTALQAMNLPDACLSASATTTLGQGDEGTTPVWSPAQGSCDATFSRSPSPGKPSAEHLRIDAVTSHAGYLILRLRSYPAWRVRVNGQTPRSLPERADGLMAVPVPQGPVKLTVDWTTTGDVAAGRWLSLVGLALLAGLAGLEHKFSSPHL
ncbi:MAG: hypothetical protein KGM96_13355 [Acidobacteriota bacterium]|nr:hypothetical protein [Acidobacteriota bacterium]